MIRILCTALLALLLAANNLAAAQPGARAIVAKVTAYYMNWETLTQVHLSAENLIQANDIVIEINDPVSARSFVEWLRLDELVARESDKPGDARLTIDIFYQDGSSSRYYADKEDLYSADSTKSRPIDQEFRDRFDIARK